MYTLIQLIALGCGAAMGVRFVTFVLQASDQFAKGWMIAKIIHDPEAYGRIRPWALRTVGFVDCPHCREAHEATVFCPAAQRAAYGAMGMPIAPAPPRDQP